LSDKLGCLQEKDDARFDFTQSAERIAAQFGVASPDELGIGDSPAAVCAVGALLGYLKDTQKTDLSHLGNLRVNSAGRYMELDIQTLKNLELAASARTGEKRGSLLWVLDRTRTPMGHRLIRAWLERPLLSPVPIKRRLEAVQCLVSDAIAREEIALVLKEIGDLERLIGLIRSGELDSWDEIHKEYDRLWAEYPAERARHAFAVLLELHDKQAGAALTGAEWNGDLERALATQELIANQTHATRAKDFTTPMRHMTYDTPEEMAAVAGTPEQDAFIARVREETAAFRERIALFQERTAPGD
jgi:DNA mismatch repair ATPase MutS